MPAEQAYEELKKRGPCGQGCGRLLVKIAPPGKGFGSAVAAAAGRLAGSHTGAGRTLEGEADLPAWAKVLVKKLKSAAGSIREPHRSHRKPNRYLDGVPGRLHRRRGKGLLLIDVSASMGDDVLRAIRTAVNRTLDGCDAVLWDTQASPRFPAKRGFDRTLAQYGGGGTDPRCAAHLRRPEEVSVWITDGYVAAWPEFSKQDVVVLVAQGGLGLPGGVERVEAL
jgi:predicted metal-dependent peptidase